MLSFNLIRWLKSLFRSRVKTIEKRPRFRPYLEHLETRLAPATATWTGASAAGTFLWSDAANWNRGTPGISIQQGDDLVFDNTGLLNQTSKNDEPAGFTVNSISISNTLGSGYQLVFNSSASANAIMLGSASATGTLTVNNSFINNSVNFNIAFGGNPAVGGNEIVDTKLSATVLTISGALSGPNKDTLSKIGVGKLILSGDNSGMTGAVDVGVGILDVQNANALGDFLVNNSVIKSHDTTVQTNARLDLNMASGVTFNENLLLLGPGTSNLGALQNVNASNTWAGKIQLGSDSTIGVAKVADTLTITGIVSDSNAGSGQILTKEGAGTLYLDPANAPGVFTGNTYHGNTIVNGGVLQIGHPYALGAGGARTIVNAAILESGTLELRYDPLTNTTVGHPQIDSANLIYANEQRITLTGALAGTTRFALSSAGEPAAPFTYTGVPATDAANITAALSSLTPIGGIGGTVTVTPVSPTVFAVVYGGNLAGLGLPLVTATITTGPGTIAVASSTNTTPVGFKVPNEFLTLNGFGVNGVFTAPRNMFTRTGGPAPAGADVRGVLDNAAGQNSWEKSVTLWTSTADIFNDSTYYEPAVCIGAAINTSLTINGVITDNGFGSGNYSLPGFPAPNPALGYSLSKVGRGRVVLTNSNLFTSDIDILQGTLNLRDSQALGQIAGIGKEAWFGTTLELQSDGIPDSQLLASKFPGQTIYDMNFPISNQIQLDGTGYQAPGAFSTEGALYNVSGVNRIEGQVDLLTTNGTTAIGVAADQDPLNLQGNTFNNLSQLTIDGVITGSGATTLTKVGLGELVLTNANVYRGPNFGQGTSQTFIHQGWITAENSQALGGRFAGRSDGVQPGVSVADGAALVLKQDVDGNNLNLAYNMRLAGTGINHRYPWLNQMGALANLDGSNVAPGDVILNGVITVAFKGTLAGSALQTMTANAAGLFVAGAKNPTIYIRTSSPGGGGANAVQSITFEGVITGGTFTLNFNGTPTGAIPWSPNVATLTTSIQNALDLLATVGSGNSVVSSSNHVGIGVELDGQAAMTPPPASQLTMTGQISEALGSGEIFKVGSQRLIVQGDGIYSGGVDVQAGVFRFQNDSALGTSVGSIDVTTTVENGAALEMAPTIPDHTGGIERGLQVFGNHLFLNGTGNSTFGDAPLTILSNDNLWRGKVTLNSNMSVTFQGNAGGVFVPLMTYTTTGAGTIGIANSITGGAGVNATQTLTFNGFNAGDTFKLTVKNAATTATATTPAIAWSANVATLLANIQTALNSSVVKAIFNTLVSVTLATLNSPVIDVLPNSRLNIQGVIDDTTATAAPSDIYVSGGGELVLGNVNTYRGTTYVNQGILTLQNGQALGGSGVTGVQELALTNAVTGITQFTLQFGNGASTPQNTTPAITYVGTDADATNIQNAMNNLFAQVTTATTSSYVQPAVGANITVAVGTTAWMSVGENIFVATGGYYRVAAVLTGTSVVLTNMGATGNAAPAVTVLPGASLSQALLIGTATTASFVQPGVGSPVTVSVSNSAWMTVGQTVRITNGGYYTVSNIFSATSVSLTNLGSPGNALPAAVVAYRAKVSETVLATAANPGNFLITFSGNLNAQLIVAAIASGAGTGSALIVTDGATVVAKGAQVQLEGNISVSSEPLTIQGQGIGLEPTVQNVIIGGTTTGTFTLAFPGAAATASTAPLPVGATATQVQNALNQALTAQVIHLTNAAANTTAFTMKFNGSPASLGVTYTGNAAADTVNIQAALNALPTIMGPGGFVTVNADPTGNDFTVIFGGSLAGTQLPISVTITSPPGPDSVSVVQPTGGQSVSVKAIGVNLYSVIFEGTFAGVNQPLLTSAVTGGTTMAASVVTMGGSANVTPTQWFNTGPAPMSNGETLGNLPVSGQITGIVTDPSDANIIYVATAGGGGWKTINGGKTWAPLFDGISAVQTVTVTGTDGTFTLQYGPGAPSAANTTSPLSANATGDQVQAALNTLPVIVSAGGSVSVTTATTPGVSEVQQLDLTSLQPGVSKYTLTFGAATTPTPILYHKTAVDITSIANALNSLSTIGGLLPTAGSVRVSATLVPGIYDITFGGSLAQEPQASVVTALVTTGAGAPPPATTTVLGVYPVHVHTITYSGGKFANQVMPTQQQIDFSNATAGATTYRLTLNNTTTSAQTGILSFAGVFATDKTTIEAALNSALFATVGGLLPVAGSVTVSDPNPGSNIYTITFGGSLAGVHQNLITAQVIGGPALGNFLVTELPLSILPVNSTVVPASGNVATADNWVINGTGKQAAMYIGAIAIAPSDSKTLYLGTGVDLNSSVSYGGTGVYKTTDAGKTWRLLTNSNPNLSHPNGDIKNFNPNPVAGLTISKIVVDPGNLASGYIPDPNLIYVATGDENVTNPQDPNSVFVPNAIPGIYRYNPNPGAGADMWFNLTSTVTVNRTLQNGQGGTPPPGTPGPDDDYRFYFPQGPNSPYAAFNPLTLGTANWTDLQILYADPLIPPHTVAVVNIPPFPIPILYAALGTSTVSARQANNAVFRVEDPNLATTTNAAWYVGEPGVPRNQVEHIHIDYTAVGTHTYKLFFGAGIYGAGFTDVMNWDNKPGFTPFPDENTSLDRNFSQMMGAGNYIIANYVGNPATVDYDVIFTGAFGFTPQAAITAAMPFNGATVTITITTFGGGVDTRKVYATEFPAGANGQVPNNGNIKFVASEPSPGYINAVKLYALVTDTRVNPPFATTTLYQTLQIVSSTNGGLDWAPVAGGVPDPNLMGIFLPNQQALGQYASTIVIQPGFSVAATNHFYVAGIGDKPGTIPGVGTGPYETTTGGASWSADLGGLLQGNSGPQVNYHASAFDANGDVLFGTDGGIWRYNKASNSWSDLNGNLAITQLNGIAVASSDLNAAVAGSQNNGTGVFSGNLAWQQTNYGTGGPVQYDPKDPSIVYGTRRILDTGNPLQVNGIYTLMKSTDGGNTWPTTLNNGINGITSFIVDTVNDQRLLVAAPGGVLGGVFESLDQGASFTNIIGNGGFSATVIAAATYQGLFQADTRFANIGDIGPDIYDKDTIYATTGSVTNITLPFAPFFIQTGIYVSKDHGKNWVAAVGPVGSGGVPPAVSGGIPDGTRISDIEVDPRNRDTAYVTVNGYYLGTGLHNYVYKTTDAGQTWNPLSTGLPEVPVWKLVIDPRTGDLYAGTDRGVYQLAGGAGTWQVFGNALANVQVRDLALNQALNTLTAGTFGRGMYQFFLADLGVNTGVLRAVSGSDSWSGPITLAGAATVSANGVQGLQNGLTNAQLTLGGAVGDLIQGTTTSQLTKIGQGDVILTGNNTYSGITEIKEGVLVAANPAGNALGDSDEFNSFTIVNVGTSLELLTDLQGEAVHLSGDGIAFNGHFQGGLYNVSSSSTISGNTYTGPLTIETPSATIGTAAGFTLTIGSKPGLLGTGSITDNGNGFSLIKELTGTLVLASANPNFNGSTTVNQGVLQLQDSNALGSAVGVVDGTKVLDGAQVQLQTPTQTNVLQILHLNALAFAGKFTLSYGNGIQSGTTAVITYNNTAGSDTTFGSDAYAIKTALTNLLTTLGLAGIVSVNPVSNTVFNITFLGQAAVGILRMTAVTTSGGAAGTVTVTVPAVLPVMVPNETLTLSGTGINGTGALENTGGNNTWGGPITLSYDPGFAKPTNPAGAVAIGVNNTVDTLTITGPIGETLPSGLAKEGTGKLTLTNSNAYSGTTYINNGIVNIQNSNALGNVQRQTATIVAGGTGYAVNDILTVIGGAFTTATQLMVTGVDGVGGIISVAISTVGNYTTPPNNPVSATSDPLNPGASGATFNLAFDSEIQRITTYDPIGTDTFKLSFNGETTANSLSFGADGATVAAALNNLGTIAAVGGVSSVVATPTLSGISEVQRLTFTGAVSSGANQTTFALRFKIPTGIAAGTTATTATINYTGNPLVDAPAIKNALNSLLFASIGGLAPAPGFVIPTAGSVKVTADLTDTIFTIDFGVAGSFLSDSHQPLFNDGPPILAVVTPGTAGSATLTEVTAGVGIPAVVYTITFNGIANQPDLVAIADPGLTAVVSTVADGGIGTLVNNNTTLDLSGDPTHAGANIAVPFNETLVVNGNGVATLTVTGVITAGTFKLTVDNQTTGPIDATLTGAALASAIETELGLLTNVGATNVTVTPNANNTFTIAFTASVTTPVFSIAPTGIVGGKVSLVTEGALHNVNGNNTWAGHVTLPASGSINVDSTTVLTVSGIVQDAPANPTPAAPNTLSKIGAGTVVLSAANTYTDNTSVNTGILKIQNSNGLGINTSAQQKLRATGNTGTFTVGFVGYPASITTGPIDTPTLTETDLQTAMTSLMALAGSPGAGFGTATVTLLPVANGGDGNTYLITFGGALTALNVPPLVIQASTGTTSAQISPVLSGGISTTLVNTGATLQLDGSVTPISDMSNKQLILNGTGVNGAGALENVAGDNTLSTTPYIMPVILGSTASIGADGASRLTINQPITDSNQQQTLHLNGFTPGNTYSLTFDNGVTPTATTASLTYTGVAASDAATIQAGLMSLTSVSRLGGTVTVVPGAAADTFVVTFGGTMAGIAWPAISGAQQQLMNFPIFDGASYSLKFNGSAFSATQTYHNVDASSPGLNAATIQATLMTLSTIPAGATVIVVPGAFGFYLVTFGGSMAGQVWPAIVANPNTITSTINPGVIPTATTQLTSIVAAYGVNKVGAGTVQYTGPNPTTYTGLTDVHAGTLELNITNPGLAIKGNLQVGDKTSVAQVQTLDLSSFGQGNKFTLSYNGSAASAPLTFFTNYDFEASLIQTALNGLSTIGGLLPTAGSVRVMSDPLNPGQFTITFGGSLAGLGASSVATITANNSTLAMTKISTLTSLGALPTLDSAEVLALADNEINNKSNVTINDDGLLNLNTHLQTIGSAGSLTMVGGDIQLPTGSTLTLGDLSGSTMTATSDAAGSALIQGDGKLKLGDDVATTFAVNAGAQSSDLIISATIQDNAQGLTKTGTGRLEIASLATAYTGDTTITKGDVQVDGMGALQTIALKNVIPPLTTKIALSYNGVTSTEFFYNGNVAADESAFTTAINSLVATPVTVTADETDVANPIFTLQFTSVVNPVYPTITSALGTGAAFLTLPNTVYNVVINGGSLSGTAAVANVIGPVSVNPLLNGKVTGKIAPGDNGTPQTTGILSVNGISNWNSGTTFSVHVGNNNGTHPIPFAGADYDQLIVYSSLNINDAMLTGSASPGIAVGDKFTILQTTGPITGLFKGVIGATIGTVANNGVVFLGGQKFTVQYFTNSVVLTVAQMHLTSFKMVTSLTPTVYGQEATYTATIVPEAGASFAAANPFITFQMDSPIHTQPVPVDKATGIAKLKLQTTFGLLAANSSHIISASFSDPSGLFASFTPPTPITQVINKGKVTINPAPVVTPASPIYGQTVKVVATLLPVVIPDVPGASNPGGKVKFVVDGTRIFESNIATTLPPNSETATLTLLDSLLPHLTAGSHTVAISYEGDANYLASTTATTINVVVQADQTTITLTPPAAPTTLGKPATFTVVVNRVAGTSGTPVGTLKFFDGATLLNAVPIAYNGGTVSYSTTALGLGTHNIKVTFTPSNSNYKASSKTVVHKVIQATTATTFISPLPGTPTYGKPIVFNLQVKQAPTVSTIALPTGTITLWQDITAAGTITAMTGNGISPIVVTSVGHGLVTGQKVTIAGVLGNTAANGTFTILAIDADSFSLTGSTGNGTYINNGVWTSGGKKVGTATITQTTGKATITSPAFAIPLGAHSFFAAYSGETKYKPSTQILNLIVASANTLTAKTTPTGLTYHYGDPVTYKVTITGTGGVTPTGPAGAITIKLGNTTIATSTAALSGSSSVATVNVTIPGGASTPLHGGANSLKVQYSGDSFYIASSATVTLNVVASPTTTTLMMPGSNPAYGAPITVNVGVTSPSAAGNPTSGRIDIKTATTNATTHVTTYVTVGTLLHYTGGTVPVTLSTKLNAGTYKLVAAFSANVNYNSSLSSPATGQTLTVTKASTVTSAVSSSPSIGVNTYQSNYGQAVTFTATVSGGGQASTTGATLKFKDTTTNTIYNGVLTSNTNSTATYKFTISTLTVNNHTIQAFYSGNSNFFASDTTAAPLSQQVVQATSTMHLTSSLPNSAYGQAVTFTATVAAQPSSPAVPPGGTVTFYYDVQDNAHILGTVTQSTGNVFKLTTTALQVGAHTIFAEFTATTNFSGVTGTLNNGFNNFNVTPAASRTALTSSPTAASWVSDKPITFTATVTFTAGTGSLIGPGNSLIFKDTVTSATYNGVLQPGSTATNAVYTYTLAANTWPAGSAHAIKAYYTVGDPNIAASSSNTLQNANVRKFSSMTLSSSQGPTIGAPITFTATFLGLGGAPIAGRTITFIIAGITYTATTNSSGKASVTRSNFFPAAGTYTIKASITGDPTFLDAFATMTVTVSSSGRLV